MTLLTEQSKRAVILLLRLLDFPSFAIAIAQEARCHHGFLNGIFLLTHRKLLLVIQDGRFETLGIAHLPILFGERVIARNLNSKKGCACPPFLSCCFVRVPHSSWSEDFRFRNATFTARETELRSKFKEPKNRVINKLRIDYTNQELIIQARHEIHQESSTPTNNPVQQQRKNSPNSLPQANIREQSRRKHAQTRHHVPQPMRPIELLHSLRLFPAAFPTWLRVHWAS